MAQVAFLYNFISSIFFGKKTTQNPWQATTLEWHPVLHPNAPVEASETKVVVHRQPCEYLSASAPDSFLPQWTETADTKPE